jgi:hypothetical protein
VRVGADVEVLRPPSEQQIADAPPDQVGGKSMILQTIQDAQGVRIDVPPGDAMLLARDNDGR